MQPHASDLFNDFVPTQLVQEHWDWARKHALNTYRKRGIPLQGRQVEADDIEHAAAVGLLKAAQTYSNVPQPFRQWAALKIAFAVTDVTRNVTSHRRMVRKADHDHSGDVTSVADRHRNHADSIEGNDLFNHLVSCIPDDRDRDIVRRVFCESQTLKQVARHYSMSVSGISVVVRRAIRLMEPEALKALL